MSDFGSDVGNTAIQVGAGVLQKFIDAILALLKLLYDNHFSAQARKAKQEMRAAKLIADERAIDAKDKAELKKIEGAVGYVKYKDMTKTGELLKTVTTDMTEREFMEFSSICKRHGVAFTGHSNVRDREIEGRKTWTLLCYEKDFERMPEVLRHLNESLILKELKAERDATIANGLSEAGIDAEDSIFMSEEAKLSHLSDEDKLRIAKIDRRVADIRRGYAYELNDANADYAADMVVGMESDKGIGFDDALNTRTGRHIDEDEISFVCDAGDPYRYVCCTGRQDTDHNGNEYVKTTYEVYNGNELTYRTDDGRFPGRVAEDARKGVLGYWGEERRKIKESGGFGDVVLKFHTLGEYKKYAHEFTIKNDKELSFLQYGKSNRDYDAIIRRLGEKLGGQGMSYDNGVVVRDDGSTVNHLDGANELDRVVIAEAIIVGKQIGLYADMKDLEQGELLLARTRMLTADEGTPLREAAQAEYDRLLAEQRQMNEREYALIQERVLIHGMQMEQINRGKGFDMEGHDHSDVGRDDKVDEVSHHKMEDWVSRIGRDEASEAHDGKILHFPSPERGVAESARKER